MIHPADKFARRIINAKKQQKKSHTPGVRRYQKEQLQAQEAEDELKSYRNGDLHQQHLGSN